MSLTFSRRTMLQASAGLIASPFVLRHARADEPIRIASLTPNTGGGAPFGPELAEAHRKVVELVNRNGGVLGREILLTQENSETNPEPAVRAARKLIDVDQVIAMTGGGPNNATSLLLFYIYQVAFSFWDTGYAAALSSVLLIVLAVVALGQFFLLDRRIHYR